MVGLGKKLPVYEDRPLYGRRFIVPCILDGKENGLVARLTDMGASVRAVAVGEIRGVDWDVSVLDSAAHGDWLIFTSKNGVRHFLRQLMENDLDIRAVGDAGIAVIGEQTAMEFVKHSINPDYISVGRTGEDLLDELLSDISESSRILWFTAKKSACSIEEALKNHKFTKVVCYENTEPSTGAPDMGDSEADGILFTCASNVKRYIARASALPKRVYSIGPTTSAALAECGITDYTQAETSTYEGLIKLL